MSFSEDVEKFVIKVGARTDAVVQRLAFEAFRSVIMRTPVKTGRARSNWQLTINELPTGAVSAGGSGASPIAAISAGLTAFKIGSIAYLSNSLPYIGVLENGGYPSPVKRGTYDRASRSYTVMSEGGFSRKAPNGMVAVTIIEMVSKYPSIVESAKKETP